MIGLMQEHRRKKDSQGGFTLIELLIVITILGVLSGVVLFAVQGSGDRGAAAAYAEDARTLRTAEEVFCGKHGQYGTERQLAGLDPAPNGETNKYIAAQSKYHAIGLSGTNGNPAGPCKRAGGINSAFSLSCNVAEPGCGAGGVQALGGTLIVGETFNSSAATTNVASSTSGGTHAWWETMYNGLLTLSEAGVPSPELATVVPTVANGGITNAGATYTLNLRPGVKWHDGGDFTATDVKFTFEKILLQFHARARNMNTPLGYQGATGTPACTAAGIVVIDPLTVQFNFTAPYVPFLKQLNVTEAAMNPASALPAFPPGVAGCPTQAQADAIKVGTGPFMYAGFGSPQAGDGKVVKNPNYWRPGLPYLDEIVMRPITADAARTSALLASGSTGGVDFVWDVPNPDVATFNANSAFRTVATQSLGGGPNSVDTVIFNLKASGSSVASVADGTAPDHPILGDVDVRKAIFHAFNRNDYLNLGRNGIGTVSKSPISSQIFGSTNDIPLPAHDVAAANALLDGAGWNGTPRVTVNGTPNTRVALNHPGGLADGTPLTIRFLQGSNIFTDRVAVMKSNLAAVGIDMPVTTNFTTAALQVFRDRDFDLHVINYAAGYDPHVGVRRQYHSDQISTTTFTNAAGYRNSFVDADFDQAVQTLDTTTRFNLYHDFQTRVVADLPYAWMIETPNVRGFTARCTGFKVWTGLFAESASCSF